MNVKQFLKNIDYINRKLGKQYPGVILIWPVDGDPNLQIPDERFCEQDEIIQYTHKLIRQCGGEAEFYPEQAYFVE